MPYYYDYDTPTPNPVATDTAQWAFVGDFPYGPISLVASIWAVNIIIYIIARFKSRKIYLRVWYLITSLIKNIIIALIPIGIVNMIYDSSRLPVLIPGIALLGASILFTSLSVMCFAIEDGVENRTHLGLVRALLYGKDRDACLLYTSPSPRD